MDNNHDTEKIVHDISDNEEDEKVTLMKKLINRLQKISQEMEKFNIAEYLNLVNNPKRFLTINFMGGIARGLGFALGATVFAALLIYVLQGIVVLNIPVIGDFITDIVKIVQDKL